MSPVTPRPLTSRTYVSLAIARGIAAAYGHPDLTGHHVALGILREGENPAVAVLHNAGVSLLTLRRDLEAELPERGRPVAGDMQLPITPGERAILDAANVEATTFHPEYIGNEHLLLALLRNADSQVSRVFARHGVTYDVALTSVTAVFPPEQ
jgi:ATP-dependent Clp protease ATP-binding subunit ClpC